MILDDDAPHLFPQMELNDLVRDPRLSKSSAELLAYTLKEKNSLSNSARITFYRSRHYGFFFYEEKDLLYYMDMAQLLHKLGVPQYQPEDWRQFIDSIKRSLKCLLLHNGNRFAYVPLAHSTTLKEKYEAVKYLLCVDLKMVNFLLGQQSGFIKYPCFLCMWDTMDRAQHHTKKGWPLRKELVPCRARSIINNPMMDRVLIKQFTKTLDKDGGYFAYLYYTFPGLTRDKLKAGIFDCPQIRLKTQ